MSYCHEEKQSVKIALRGEINAWWSWTKAFSLRHRMALAVIVAGYLLYSLCFSYGDGPWLTNFGTAILEALYEGNPSRYYEIFYTNASYQEFPPTKINAFNFILIGVWNFPVWLAQHFFPGAVSSLPAAVFWEKLMYVPVLLWMGFYMTRIMTRVGVSERMQDITVLTFWGAVPLTISVFFFGQDEMLYLLTMLMGIDAVSCRRKVMEWICFSLTVVLNPIMLPPVLMILLLRHKNLLFVVGTVVSYFIPAGLFFLLFGGTTISALEKMYHPMHKAFPMTALGGWFFQPVTFHSPYGDVSVFFLLLVAAFLFTWLYREKENIERMTIDLTAVYLVILLLVAWEHVYRYVIYLPFLLLAVAIRKERIFYIGLIAAILLNLSHMLYALTRSYAFSLRAVAPFMESVIAINSPTYYKAIGADAYLYDTILVYHEKLRLFAMGIPSCIWSAGLSAIGLLIFSRRVKDIVVPFRAWALIKTVYLSLPIAMFVAFFCLNGLYYDSTGPIEHTDRITEKLSDGAEMQQTFDVNKDITLQKICLHPITWRVPFSDQSVLHIKIYSSDAQCVYDDSISLKEFRDNADYRKNVAVRLKEGQYRVTTVVSLAPEDVGKEIAFNQIRNPHEGNGETMIYRMVGRR